MRVAIVGHIPHDRYVFADGSTHVGFGGILYGVAALSGALGPHGSVVAISRIGGEIEPSVRAVLERYGNVEAILQTVPGEGWVVHATYLDGENRRERLVGGVPPWTAEELISATRSCDAVLLNMVTGFETTLPHYRRFAAACPSLHLDFHSLALGRDADGLRFPTPRPDARAWCEVASTLQMNRVELSSVLQGPPLEAASRLSTWGPRAVVITDGSGGVYVAHGGEALHLPAPDPTPTPQDPTGCGDVFGACFLVGILRGRSPVDAACEAQVVARRNANVRGIPLPETLDALFAGTPSR